MIAERIIHGLLSGNAAVNTATGGRIYPIHAAQNDAFPYITYQLIAEVPDRTLAGQAGSCRSLIQVNVQDRGKGGYGRVKDLANKVRLALSGFRGTVGDDHVQGIQYVSGRDEPTPPGDATDHHYYGVQMDYRVWHTQAVPAFA